MNYISVAEIALKWGINERSVRKYCSEGRVSGAVLQGKTWLIPENAEKPQRKRRDDAKPKTLLDILAEEKKAKLRGGIYHKVQIELTYNSNHIEGSRLTHDQTRYIYETNTIGITDEAVKVDDVIETANH
ncbi:MAG: cell filamentation protein Fic, partial [Clostridia bacterium]|nr:cell filamentation protein Fic [Clostridia bacterium]